MAVDAVWGLKHENKILGVRVRTDYNQYYDIDIDVYKKQLHLDPSILTCLNLIEMGDLLVTEDEFNGGYIIDDGSTNQEILKQTKEYVIANNKVDPKAIAKRRKKTMEYRKKYYTYLPDAWLKEFAEYHYDTFEGNGNIYSNFSTQQFNAIKDYMRWRSRLIFEEKKASKILRTKADKSLKLIELMGNADDWVYDGTVDTGYKGGSHCELGHPLRYEHYAFSPSQNRHIVFGSTCMSDFFQLDESVIRHITQAQEILLKEVKSIVFIINTGKQSEYANAYRDLPKVLQLFDGKYNKVMRNGAGWAKYITTFYRMGLPLTRSMKYRMEEFQMKYTKEKEYSSFHEIIDKTQNELKQYLYPHKVVDDILHDRYDLTLAKNVKLSLLYGKYTSTFSREGIKAVPLLAEVQRRLSGELVSSRASIGFLSNAKRLYPFVYAPNGRRVATKREIQLDNEKIVREPYLGKHKTEMLHHLVHMARPDMDEPVRELELVMPTTLIQYISEFERNLDIIKEALEWGTSNEFFADMKGLRQPIRLLDSAEDELVEVTTPRVDGAIRQPATNSVRKPSRQPEKQATTSSVFAKSDFKPIVTKKDEEEKEPEVTLDSSLQEKYDYIDIHLAKLPERERNIFRRLSSNQKSGSKDAPLIDEFFVTVYNKLNDVKLTVKSPEPAKTFVVKEAVPLTDELDTTLSAIEEAGADGILKSNNFVFTIIPTIRRTGRMTEKQAKYVNDALVWIDKQF